MREHPGALILVNLPTFTIIITYTTPYLGRLNSRPQIPLASFPNLSPPRPLQTSSTASPIASTATSQIHAVRPSPLIRVPGASVIARMALAFLQRRAAMAYAAALLTMALCFLFYYHDAALAKAAEWGSNVSGGVTDVGVEDYTKDALFATDSDAIRRVAILETGGTHDEVTAALVHAFGGQPDVELALMLKHQRYNMEDIMAAFELASPVSKIVSSDLFPKLVGVGPQPHILISTTCQLDINIHTDAFRKMLSEHKTHLMCLMHHADRWASGKTVNIVRAFVEEGRADFIGLSPHTVDFLQSKTIPEWKLDLNVTARVFPPIFPVKLPEPNVEAAISLAMQGDYSSGRRDYQHTFEQLGGLIEKLRSGDASASEKDREVVLHVIGHGKTPSVPEDLAKNVVFDESLSYPDFYAVLSDAFAIIPAFASDEYLDRKASSTVPAAIIAGAPMVASEEILKAYSYLPREAVWVSEPGEEEMDTVRRFIGDSAAYLDRVTKMREASGRILEDNRILVGQWLTEIIG